MKILHLADIHARDKDLDEIQKCLGKVLETATEEKPDLIVIAGDIFEFRDIALDSESVRFIFHFVRSMAIFAPVAIVLGTPSHDGHAPEALFYASGRNHNVWVAKLPEQLILKNGILHPAIKHLDRTDHDAIISMLSTPTKQHMQATDDGLDSAMSPIFSGMGAFASQYECPHIMVGHFSVRGAAISETQTMVGRDIEIGKDQIELAKADVVCLGHIHKAQKIEPNIFYSGSIYRKDFGEMEEKGFFIHEAGATNLSRRFIKTPTRKLAKYSHNLIEDPYLCPMPEIEKDSIVRLEYTIYQDQAVMIDREGIEKDYKDAGAKEVDIRIIRVPRENVRSEKIIQLTTLRDKIQERARLENEEISESILSKADQLEESKPDDIINSVIHGTD